VSTVSASTPRLRATFYGYLALLALTAVNRPAVAPPIVEALLAVTAMLAVSASALGRIWCSVFIAGRKDAQLVTTGPYAMCRHPLYALSMLAAAGLGMASGSVVLTAVVLLMLAVLFRRAAAAEEQVLAELHGAAFARYVAATPRFWPRGGPHDPWHETVLVRPRVLWKAFLDAGSILLLLALILLAASLQRAGWLPTLVRLP
jgi:protein-S-isoprenylcysteine O-methyltransferase Ste14